MAERALKFGIVTPMVTHLPGRHAKWELTGGAAELRQIAITADRCGFYHLTCSEHVGIPTEVGKVRGHRYYDPLATFGYMAAVTRTIRFATHVLVLPYHHPLAVAKRYGTLDKMSEGRVILGIGVGSLKQEFDLLGAEFERRGEIYTEALQALRESFGKQKPVFKGKFYQYDDFVIDPHGVQERVPIWLGGRTKLSLKRSLTSADGWDPFGFNLAGLSELLPQARQWPEWQSRKDPFDVVLGPEPVYDITTPAGLASMTDQIASYRKAGGTILNMYFRSDSLEHYCEQLELFRDRVAPKFR
jgi:probable F420-dependent oxidoreductase